MKWIKTAAPLAVACSMLAFSAGTAEAQYTPTLTATASGSTVVIEWTPIAGAQGYTVQAGNTPTAANIATVNVPSGLTRAAIDAPPGTYYLRVRAYAGTLVGPYSAIVSVTVGGSGGGGGGGGACTTPPAPPVATFTVSGPSVTINWGAVNAAAYRVEFSRTPGITELAQVVTGGTTSFTQYIPMLGTFYARVTAGNTCGIVTGNEVAFTITSLSGSGPRTPDPAPGQLLPMPAYGHDVALGVSKQYAGDLANVCGNPRYLYRLVHELRKRDSRWGLNWKRGYVGHEMSRDIVTYNPTNVPDNGAKRLYLVDVVHAICDGNGFSWNWEETTQKTWDAGQDGLCGNEWCAAWTIDPYLAAGFPPDPKD